MALTTFELITKMKRDISILDQEIATLSSDQNPVALSLLNDRKSELTPLLEKEEMHARAVIRSLGLHIPEFASLLQDYLDDANEDDAGNAEVAAEVVALAEVADAPAEIPVPRWCAEMSVAYNAAFEQLDVDSRVPEGIHGIMKLQFPGLTLQQVQNRKKRVAKAARRATARAAAAAAQG